MSCNDCDSEVGPVVVALDGPAGVGKSTVAMAVASALGLSYVETGALYRAVGLAGMRAEVPGHDEEGLARIAAAMDIRFSLENGVNRVFLAGDDITASLRLPEMGPLASMVSAHPQVRSALLTLQRALGRTGRGAVLEGRDIGTVIFPDSPHKFFLTAAPEVRAERRRRQLESKGQNVGYEAILEEIKARDGADSGRAVAPLKAAHDAMVVCTDSLTATQVVDLIVRTVRAGGPV